MHATEVIDVFPEGWKEMDPGGNEVYHCCLNCGFIPIEGMVGYRYIHSYSEATCVRCNVNLAQLEDEARTIAAYANSPYGV